MGYLAYQTHEDELLDRVQARCRSLTTNGKFTDTTSPTRADVEQWITDSYYRVAGILRKAGYGTAVTGSEALGILAQIQALGAAMTAQQSTRSGITEEDQKYRAMLGEWNGLVHDFIYGGMLEDIGGVTRARPLSQHLDATGRSQSRKTTVYSDSDVVPARFRRGFAQQPGSTTAATSDRDD